MALWKKPKKKVVKRAKTVPKAPPDPYTPPPLPKFELPTVSYNKTEEKQAAEKLLDPEKEFMRVFKELCYGRRGYDIWSDFIVMSACAFSNAMDESHYEVREARYLSIIKKYTVAQQHLFPELLAHLTMALDQNPEQDFLGKLYMELDLYDKSREQIFTPYHVCELMADISVGDGLMKQIEEDGYITIGDPCCGAGATLIAGVNSSRKVLEKENLNFQNHVLVAAQDIDETVALMCYLQLSLLGVAGYIKVGNSITEPMRDEDSMEDYWFTPMYFSDIWKERRMIEHFRAFMRDSMKGD